MKLNIAKYATTNMVKGVPKADGLVLVNGENFPLVTEENPYKYLGILQVFQPIAGMV